MLCKILTLFVNALTADDKYSLLNSDNFTQPNQILVSQKQKTFSESFFAFLKSTLNFVDFQKKIPSQTMCFRNYGLRKKWFDKCLKTPVSDQTSTSNMVKGPKHICNLDDSTFTILIDHWEANWVWKSLFQCYAKFGDCLLTHSLSLTSILFLIETISRNQLRYSYLRKKRFFLNFSLHFWNLH